MSKIELEGILTIAFGGYVIIGGDFEVTACHFCKEYVEGIVDEKDVPHLENCLHVKMKKYIESLGYTREDYEKLFCESEACEEDNNDNDNESYEDE